MSMATEHLINDASTDSSWATTAQRKPKRAPYCACEKLPSLVTNFVRFVLDYGFAMSAILAREWMLNVLELASCIYYCILSSVIMCHPFIYLPSIQSTLGHEQEKNQERCQTTVSQCCFVISLELYCVKSVSSCLTETDRQCYHWVAYHCHYCQRGKVPTSVRSLSYTLCLLLFLLLLFVFCNA